MIRGKKIELHFSSTHIDRHTTVGPSTVLESIKGSNLSRTVQI